MTQLTHQLPGNLRDWLPGIIQAACVQEGMPEIRELIETALRQAQRKAHRRCGHRRIANRWSEGTGQCWRCGWFVDTAELPPARDSIENTEKLAT